MGALFSNGTGNFIRNSTTPITAVPFTVGFWYNPVSASSGIANAFWSISQSGAVNTYFRIQKSTADVITFSAALSPTAAAIATGTVAVTFGAWHYILARAASATFREVSVLFPGGQIETVSNTTSTVPTSLALVEVGASHAATNTFSSCNIAEYFITNADIQPDGTALQTSTLRQLARGGPFSLPHISNSIMDYRSFRQSLGSEQDGPDTFNSPLGRQVWVSTNSPILSAHPPLPGGYRGPNDQIRTGMV